MCDGGVVTAPTKYKQESCLLKKLTSHSPHSIEIYSFLRPMTIKMGCDANNTSWKLSLNPLFRCRPPKKSSFRLEEPPETFCMELSKRSWATSFLFSATLHVMLFKKVIGYC